MKIDTSASSNIGDLLALALFLLLFAVPICYIAEHKFLSGFLAASLIFLILNAKRIIRKSFK